jgi:hypothetical protein
MGNNRKSNLKNTPSSKTIIKRIVPFILIIMIMVAIIYIQSLFTIKNIECQQNNIPCSAATLDKIEHLKGASVFFTDFDKSLSQFEPYDLQKKLPNTLRLTLNGEPSNYYQVAENGEVIISQQEVINPALNQKIHTLFLELDESNIEYTKIAIKEDTSIIMINDSLRALIDLTESVSGVYKLKQVLDNVDLKEVDTAIVEIDTRFTMPVLKTRQTDL